MNENMESQLRFDTVKFVTDSQCLTAIINDSLFKHDLDPTTGEIRSVEFNSRKWRTIIPFELYIYANYQSKRMTIEFSSKILLDDYPLLISGDNFSQCLQNIEKLGICTLNIEGVIANCYFNKLHITKDVDLELTPMILDRLNLCTGDYRRYKWTRYANSILFTKNVMTTNTKEEMSIYNKGQEILLPKNRDFLKLVRNQDRLTEYYIGKTRVEMKLENKRKIMKELGISDTSMDSIMRVEKNVLLAQFDKIFIRETNPMKPKSDMPLINNILDYALLNTIRYHNADLQKIEQEIKDIGLYRDASRGAMGKQMKKIRLMTQAWNNQELDSDGIIEEVRSKLK